MNNIQGFGPPELPSFEDKSADLQKEPAQKKDLIGDFSIATDHIAFQDLVEKKIIEPNKEKFEEFKYNYSDKVKRICENKSFKWNDIKEEGRKKHGIDKSQFEQEWGSFRNDIVTTALDITKDIFQEMGHPFPDTRTSGTPGIYSDADYMIRELKLDEMGFENEEDLQFAKLCIEQILLNILDMPAETALEMAFYTRHNGNLNSYETIHSLDSADTKALAHYQWIERMGALLQGAVQLASDGILTFDPKAEEWQEYLQVERQSLLPGEVEQFNKDVAYVEAFMKSEIEPQAEAIVKRYRQNHPELAKKSNEEVKKIILEKKDDPKTKVELDKLMIAYQAPRQLEIAKELSHVGRSIKETQNKLDQLVKYKEGEAYSKDCPITNPLTEEQRLKNQLAEYQIRAIALHLARVTTYIGGYFTEGSFVSVVLAVYGQMHERLTEKRHELQQVGAPVEFNVKMLPRASFYHWLGAAAENYVLTMHEFQNCIDGGNKLKNITLDEELILVEKSAKSISKYMCRTIHSLIEMTKHVRGQKVKDVEQEIANVDRDLQNLRITVVKGEARWEKKSTRFLREKIKETKDEILRLEQQLEGLKGKKEGSQLKDQYELEIEMLEVSLATLEKSLKKENKSRIRSYEEKIDESIKEIKEIKTRISLAQSESERAGLKIELEILEDSKTLLENELKQVKGHLKNQEELEGKATELNNKKQKLLEKMSELEKPYNVLENKIRELYSFALDMLRIKRDQYISKEDARMYFEIALDLEEKGTRNIREGIQLIALPPTEPGVKKDILSQKFIQQLGEVLVKEELLTEDNLKGNPKHTGWEDLKTRLQKVEIKGRPTKPKPNASKKKVEEYNNKEREWAETTFAALKEVAFSEFPEMTESRKSKALKTFGDIYDQKLAPDQEKGTVATDVPPAEIMRLLAGKVAFHGGAVSWAKAPSSEDVRMTAKALSEELLLRGEQLHEGSILPETLPPSEPAERGGFWFMDDVLQAIFGARVKSASARKLLKRASTQRLEKHEIKGMKDLTEKVNVFTTTYQDVSKRVKEDGFAIQDLDPKASEWLLKEFPK